jgi:hypothetical protein
MTDWVKGILAGVVGVDVWGFLPVLGRAIIWAGTLCLPRARREIRRREWGAELESYDDRRVSGLVWAICLLGVCAWERATTPIQLRPRTRAEIGAALRTDGAILLVGWGLRLSTVLVEAVVPVVLLALIVLWLSIAIVPPPLATFGPALIVSECVLCQASVGVLQRWQLLVRRRKRPRPTTGSARFYALCPGTLLASSAHPGLFLIGVVSLVVCIGVYVGNVLGFNIELRHRRTRLGRLRGFHFLIDAMLLLATVSVVVAVS